MGEMADYALSAMDPWNEHPDHDTAIDGPYCPIHYKTCRCCGISFLTWGVYEGKWRLFEGKKLHVCPVNPLLDVKETTNE